MYKSPDFVKIPVKVDNSFASYFCDPTVRVTTLNNGPDDVCLDTSYTVTTRLLDSFPEFPTACYNDNAAPY